MITVLHLKKYCQQTLSLSKAKVSVFKKKNQLENIQAKYSKESKWFPPWKEKYNKWCYEMPLSEFPKLSVKHLHNFKKRKLKQLRVEKKRYYIFH